MDAPAITRRHRPFLAPIWLMALLLMSVLAVALTFYNSANTTTVVLVRPALAAASSIADSPLVPEDEAGARELARLFGDAAGQNGRIEAIYVMPGRRTEQTAAPLAGRLGLAPRLITETDVGDAAANVLSEHRGQVVLVVTTAQSIERWIEVLSGSHIASAGNGANVYVISIPTLGSPGLLLLNY